MKSPARATGLKKVASGCAANNVPSFANTAKVPLVTANTCCGPAAMDGLGGINPS